MNETRVQMYLFALPAGCLAVLAARFGGGYNGFDTLRVAGILAGAAIVAALLVKTGVTGRLAGGRYVQVHGHAHGTGSNLRKQIAKHEAGHAVAARALGGRVKSATLYAGNRGGVVDARLPNARAHAAFLLAGQYAVNSSEGAGADNAALREVLREFPSKDRSRVKAEAKREARRIVSSRSGEISSYARKLDARGRL